MTKGHDDRVRDRAYHLWQAGGGAHGQEMEHWLQAEQDVAAESKPPGGSTAKAPANKAPAKAAAPKPAARKPAAPKAAPAEPKVAKATATKPKVTRAQKPES